MTVKISTNKFMRNLRQATERGLVRATEAVRTEAVRLVNNPPKTGEVYTKRGGVTHQASAPGEAPAGDTGNLAKLITTTYDFSNMVGIVDSAADYSAFLEFGTKNMEARPFMRPALANMRSQIPNLLTAEVRGIFGGGILK